MKEALCVISGCDKRARRNPESKGMCLDHALEDEKNGGAQKPWSDKEAHKPVRVRRVKRYNHQAYQKAYREKNREKLRAYMREYYHKNREKAQAERRR